MAAPPNSPEGDLRWSRELDLVLLCARWPQRAEDRDRIRARAAGPLNWPHFLRLVQHHRLVPLVAQNLSAALADTASPGQRDVIDTLGGMASANAYRALRSLAELRRVVQELQAVGVQVRVLKGIPLAQSIFGDLSLRATGDLDLLIEESSILDADRVLRQFNYKGLFRLDRFTPKRLSFYRTHWKDLAYRDPDTGFEIDLHWRCFRNSEMPGAGLCETTTVETISFGSFQVSTLPPTETLLYLCVHGTLDGWLFLKSLADVAAQVRTMTPAQLDEVAAQAAAYGILPEVSASLTLVRRYFTMDAWTDRLLPQTDPTVGHILKFTDQALISGGFLSNRDAISTAAMMAFELGLRRNLRYRAELLVRILFRARMWETIPLPDFLFGVYPLLSPFEWIFFRVRQWFEKPPTPTASLSV